MTKLIKNCKDTKYNR